MAVALGDECGTPRSAPRRTRRGPGRSWGSGAGAATGRTCAGRGRRRRSRARSTSPRRRSGRSSRRSRGRAAPPARRRGVGAGDEGGDDLALVVGVEGERLAEVRRAEDVDLAVGGVLEPGPSGVAAGGMSSILTHRRLRQSGPGEPHPARGPRPPAALRRALLRRRGGLPRRRARVGAAAGARRARPGGGRPVGHRRRPRGAGGGLARRDAARAARGDRAGPARRRARGLVRRRPHARDEGPSPACATTGSCGWVART